MTTPILAGMRGTADRINQAFPRTLAYQAITANTGTTTTTETIAITTPSFTLRTGRAFIVKAKALYTSSVAADHVTIRVRRTNVAGSPVLDSQRLVVPAAGNSLFYAENVFVNTTGSDLTGVMVLNFLRAATGTGNVSLAASSSQVAFLMIQDIGLATDYPSATSVT